MTRTELRTRTRKQLDFLARSRRIPGRHSMNKEELIDALLTRRPSNPTKPRRSTNGRKGHVKSRKKQTGRRLLKPVSTSNAKNATLRDRLIAEALDSQWIEVRWTLTRRILQRAQAALGLEWHHAVPVIRVLDVTADKTTTASNSWMRDVELDGNVDRWYIPVDDPTRVFKMQIGYRAPSGRFFVMARSNRVRAPRRSASRTASPNRSRKRQRMDVGGRVPGRPFLGSAKANGNGKPRASTTGSSAMLIRHGKNGSRSSGDPFEFRVEAELVVHGATHPDAELTVLGERIPLEKDGTFCCRIVFPEGRQVIPAIVVTPCGTEQRTIVLGVERNTKELEPQRLDELSL